MKYITRVKYLIIFIAAISGQLLAGERYSNCFEGGSLPQVIPKTEIVPEISVYTNSECFRDYDNKYFTVTLPYSEIEGADSNDGKPGFIRLRLIRSLNSFGNSRFRDMLIDKSNRKLRVNKFTVYYFDDELAGTTLYVFSESQSNEFMLCNDSYCSFRESFDEFNVLVKISGIKFSDIDTSDNKLINNLRSVVFKVLTNKHAGE